jgi:hypothetical protein
MACCVNDSGSIIIANGDQNVYMSINSGASWTKYPKAKFSGFGGLHKCWAISNDGKYHIRTPYASSSYFYVSNDNMASWRPFGSLLDSWSYYNCFMSSDGKFQVVNGNNISYMSSDNGTTWKSSTKYTDLFITRDGTKLFSNNNISKDFGKTWTADAQFNFDIMSPNGKIILFDNRLYKIV